VSPVAKKSARAPRIFYGWLVVAGGFLVTFVGFGCVYSFSVFIGSLQQDFGASRGAVSLVFSLAGFLYFALGMVSGPLADRFGSRLLAVIGMILIGAGLALASLAQNLLQVFLAFGLGAGLGVGFSYVPAMGAVQPWFIKRRGFASGLASSGIGAGTLAVPPLAALFIARLGWREAYLVLGVLAAVVGIAAALLLENDPRDRGLSPDGEIVPPGDNTRPETASLADAAVSIRDAIKTRHFLGLYAACLACALGVFVPFVHLAPYALDHGIAQSLAVLLVSAIGIGSTVGRFFLGGLADRLGRILSLFFMFVGMAASLLLWAASTQFWPLAGFALIFGIFYGGWVALLPSVVMDYFGGRNVSGIIGVLYTSAGIGTLIGPSAAGFAFDISRSYTVPILVCAAANIIAAAIMATTSKPMTKAAAKSGPHD
jgi:OFA family oxalate/formate antiporter-like MFS transporter